MQDGQLQISRQLMMAQQLQWHLPLVHVWWQSVMDLSKMSLAQPAGSFKWVAQQEVGKLAKFAGSCITPSQPSDQSTYHSELTGIFGIITIMDAVCQYHGIGMGWIEMACDGLSALEQATIDSNIVNPKYPQFDLVLTIYKAIHHSPLVWTFCHVKGHQDDWDIELDHWEWLNVQMDADAKRYWAAQVDHDQLVQQRVWGKPWSLWQGDQKICNNVRKAVHEGIHGPQCLEYWSKLGQFGTGMADDIDWAMAHKAFKLISWGQRREVVKHASGFCGTNKNMKCWKKWESDACPLCSQPEEDAWHVTTCPNP